MMRSIWQSTLPSTWQFLASASLTTIVALAPAAAQNQQQIDQCMNNNGTYLPDSAIEACTAAIQSGNWSGKGLAWTYNNLGKAYYMKQDYNRALSEYNEALQLDPNDAYAYCGRGMTKTKLGDDSGGQVDISRAQTLMPTLCKD